MGEFFVVGIAGGSGSGKSTFTDNLLRHFGDHACVLHHDNYYKAHDDMSYEERCTLNYDCPEAFDGELVAEHLRLLREGKSVRCPVYDFTVHNRSETVTLIEPRPIVIMEGILILAQPELRELMDLKIFVDTDADVRLARRVVRDVEKRGRTVRSVVEQWQKTVKPMHEKYVEPSRKKADVIIPEGGKNRVALELVIDRLQRHLDENS